jgi:hypothetical protein
MADTVYVERSTRPAEQQGSSVNAFGWHKGASDVSLYYLDQVFSAKSKLAIFVGDLESWRLGFCVPMQKCRDFRPATASFDLMSYLYVLHCHRALAANKHLGYSSET